MSVEEENKAIIRRWIEGYNKHDPKIAEEFISEDYVGHELGKDTKGPEGFKQGFTFMLSIFPDHYYTINDMVAEGDRVAVRYTETGTHKGEMMGIVPTGKRFTITEDIFYRIAGGKIVEASALADVLSLYQQLGISPPGQ